jgi:hypothetical protein
LILTHLYREASFRAHGAGPERGHAEPQRGTERKGQERFGYFRLGRHSGFSKVTRCKSETNSGRYPKNGYTPNQSVSDPRVKVAPRSLTPPTAVRWWCAATGCTNDHPESTA